MSDTPVASPEAEEPEQPEQPEKTPAEAPPSSPALNPEAEAAGDSASSGAGAAGEADASPATSPLDSPSFTPGEARETAAGETDAIAAGTAESSEAEPAEDKDAVKKRAGAKTELHLEALPSSTPEEGREKKTEIIAPPGGENFSGPASPEISAGETSVFEPAASSRRSAAALLLEEFASHRTSVAAVLLGLSVFLLYLIPAGRPLTETSEARTAVVAREMSASGDFIVPRLGGKIRLRKPPLPYWLTVGAAKLTTALQRLGSGEAAKPVASEEPAAGGASETTAAACPPSAEVDEWAARFPSATAATLCVFLTVLFGAAVFNFAVGWWAGLLVGLSALTTASATTGGGECILLFFFTAALFSLAWLTCRERPGVGTALLLGLALAGAVLTKFHVVLLVLLPAVAEVLSRRRFNRRKVLLFVAALLIAVAAVAWWPWLLLGRLPAEVEPFRVLWRELVLGVSPIGHRQNDRWFYYLYKSLYGLLPWTPLILAAFWVAWRRGRAAEDGEALGPRAGMWLEEEKEEQPRQEDKAKEEASFARFFALAAGLGFVVFYLMPKQQDYYLLPLLPPFALTAGRLLSRLRRPGGLAEERIAWAHLLGGFLVGAAVLALPWWLPQTGFDAAARGWELPGWVFCLSWGLATMALSFVGARQWVESRPSAAGLCLALPVLTAAVFVLVLWADKECRSDNLPDRARVDRVFLRVGLGAAERRVLGGAWRWNDPQSRFYGAGKSRGLLVYYYGRPVRSLRELAAETKAEDAPRVLVCKKQTARGMGISKKLWVCEHPAPPWKRPRSGRPDGNDYVLALLPTGRDWPAAARNILEARRKKAAPCP